jgi:hypothetical protein
VEANVMRKNVAYWLAFGFNNLAGVLATIDIVRRVDQLRPWEESLTSYALLLLAAAVDALIVYILLSRRAN